MPAPDVSNPVSDEERQLNLLVTFLSYERALTTEQIARNVYGYNPFLEHDQLYSIIRKDRQALEKLGVKFLVEGENGDQNYAFTVDVEQTRNNPALRFTAEETAWLALAYQLEGPKQLPATWYAVLSLTPGQGFGKYTANHKQNSLPHLADSSVRDKRIDSLALAIKTHQIAVFEYQSAKSQKLTKRHLHPFGLFEQEGKMYVWGVEQGRRGARSYKLERMGDVRVEPAAKPAPEHVELPTLLRPASAIVALAPGKMHEIRNVAIPMTPAQMEQTCKQWGQAPLRGEVPPDWQVFMLTEINRFELINRLVAGLDAIKVLAPTDIKNQVICRLTELTTLGQKSE